MVRNRCQAVLSVRLGRAHMRHQRVLMIGMAGGTDAEQLAGLRGGPVGAEQQLAAQLAAIAQADTGIGFAHGNSVELALR